MMGKMKKGNISPELINKTEKMSVPATKGVAYSIRPEGKVEYPRGEATSNSLTRGMTPKLTNGK